jgi:hypothetical protein
VKKLLKKMIPLALISAYPCIASGYGNSSSVAPLTIKDNYSEDFRLIDQNDNSHAMSYYSDFKLILLIGFNLQCQSNLEKLDYLKKLEVLSKKYNAKIFFIDPDVRNDRKVVQSAMRNFKNSYPVLMDEIQMISSSYDIKNAGDFVLIEAETLTPFLKGSLYKTKCTSLLSEAIKSGHLSERIINCHDQNQWDKMKSYLSLKYIPDRCNFDIRPTKNINYTQHVAPIIKTNCIMCHVGEDFGSFNSYKKVVGWSAMIRQVIRDQRMPPGGSDSYYHGFLNDYNIRDLRYLVEWAESKKERGPGQDVLENFPTLKTFKFLDKNIPDLTFSQKKVHVIPASGTLEYQETQLGGPMKEDLWIRALNLKINYSVVHHANLLVLDKPLEHSTRKTTYDGMRKISKIDKLLYKTKDEVGYALLFKENIALTSKKLDNSPIIMPKGLALLIPKGKYLAIELHYNTTGKIEHNKTVLEIFLYKNKTNLKVQKALCIHRNRFTIPPRTKNFIVTSRVKLPGAITAVSLKPHFHFRGKSIKYIIEEPSGTKQTLLSVPFYQFKHQPLYIFKSPHIIPNGSFLITEVVYDNSKEFFQNPDQSISVPLGSQTYTDEMHLPRLFYVDGAFKVR